MILISKPDKPHGIAYLTFEKPESAAAAIQSGPRLGKKFIQALPDRD